MISLTMICKHRFLSLLLEFDEDPFTINRCLKNNGHQHKVLKWCHLMGHSVLYSMHLSASLRGGGTMPREIGQLLESQGGLLKRESVLGGGDALSPQWDDYYGIILKSATLSPNSKYLNLPTYTLKSLPVVLQSICRLRKLCLFLTWGQDNSFLFINCEHYDSIGTNLHLGQSKAFFFFYYCLI